MRQPPDVNASDLPLGAVEVPWNLVVPTADIYLVGYGNRLPNDFTLEMIAVLKRCKRVFGMPPIHAPTFSIPPMESLAPLYGAGKRRMDTYREMADRVLDAAAADPPVGLATYGSAMVGAFAPHLILEEAAARGLTVHVTNTVSCFDGLWVDFNWDPYHGFEVWEATAFLRLQIEPNVAANLLLPQAPVLDVTTGFDTKTMTIETSSSLAQLRDHLLRFYPADHVVHYVKTSSGAGQLLASDIESLELRDLDHPGREVLSTLVVPRARHPKRCGSEVANSVLVGAPVAESG
jgi:uncharacterized protein YabN with tetrapyrrole methylase and pyrophosphatase domain